MMSKEAKAKKAEYMRKWRAKPENKKKQREYERNYWERKAKEDREE